MTWEAIWALPNVDLDEPVDSAAFALVPPSDPRVQVLARAHRNFRAFLNQFQDTHSNPIMPTLILRRTNVPDRLKQHEVAASFRDLIVASSVPIARSLDIVYDNALDRVRYSSFFWIYPWMLDRNYEHLIAPTPAMLALHDVNQFLGHSSPDLPRATLRRRHVDEPLLQQLLRRWRARYESTRPDWVDVALFRSLHMANQACLIPAGADAVLHDYGRMTALWTAAFEILVHPGSNGHATLRRVLDLLEKVPWLDRKLAYRRYSLKIGRMVERKNLACWLYKHIYSCRNAFLHGNPVTIDTLRIPTSGRPLPYHAATLYRLALTAFLDLKWMEPVPSSEDPEILATYWDRRWKFRRPQVDCEQALNLSRVSIDEQRRDRENRLSEVRRVGRMSKRGHEVGRPNSRMDSS